jgi:hypothetical protein
MDEKKVREAIYCMKSFVDEAVCEECDYYETCDHTRAEENAKIAIKALEKQLPKRPRENGMSDGLIKKTKYYTCQTCGNCLLTEMMNERQNTNYCWDCGQRLDWSE